MRSSTPKILHPVCGRPMVAWPILAAREAGAGRVAAIVSPERDISAGLPEGTEIVVQPVSDGTGGALRAALPLIRGGRDGLVLSGDHPLVSAEIVAGLLAACAIVGRGGDGDDVELDDPGSYGRIVRGEGSGDRFASSRRRPASDATPEELEIREVNAGTYAFAAAPLATALERHRQRQRPGRVLPGRRLRR